jgi:rhodanese-related sulfurtransferase
VDLISREELKQKLDRNEKFKLVMVLAERAYRAAHIPGSAHFPDPETALNELAPEDEIIVYCAGVTCMASAMAYYYLKSHGYENVRRYAGGLEDWQAAGYPLEGEQV